MMSYKNICLLSFFLISGIFISCSDDGPVQTEETENQVKIDSELIGTWQGLGPLPKTVVFGQNKQSNGSGVEITEDLNGYCENVDADYLSRIDFKWTQTKKVKEDWSAFNYEQISHLECGGAERAPRVSFERYYKIEGDTLYLGTEDYQIYVRVE